MDSEQRGKGLWQTAMFFDEALEGSTGMGRWDQRGLQPEGMGERRDLVLNRLNVKVVSDPTRGWYTGQWVF